jgi:hypothetical protein
MSTRETVPHWGSRQDRKLEAMRYLSGELAIVLDCRDQKGDGPLPLELLTPRLNKATRSELGIPHGVS